MNDIEYDYSAIILASTFNEEEKYILNFLIHISKISESLQSAYNILPVLVFEKSEDYKRISIQDELNKKNLKIIPILLTNNNNKGFASCLNYGIKKTSSKYIFRLDTDDRTNNKRIIDQIEIMNSKNLDITYGYAVDQNKNLLKYPSNIKSISIMMALGTNPVPHPTVCIKRESLLLLYNENLNRCEDFEFWLRLFLSNTLNFEVLKYPITKYSIERSAQKDKQNAKSQIKIRLKFARKLFLSFLFISIGIIPNILRILLPNNALLFFRRKI